MTWHTASTVQHQTAAQEQLRVQHLQQQTSILRKEHRLALSSRLAGCSCLGEVVTSVAAAGLVLVCLEEEPGVKLADAGLPKLFTLVARKPA